MTEPGSDAPGSRAEYKSPQSSTRRRNVAIVAVVAVLAVAGAGAALAFGGASTPSSSPTPSSSASPSPTPTPEPVSLPRTAPSIGTVADWQLAPSTAIASVLPAVGEAADGKLTLMIDAPTVDAPVRAASVSTPVVAGVTYQLKAKVRVSSVEPVPVSAALEAGETHIALPPAIGSEWVEVSGAVTPAETANLDVALRIDGPVEYLAIDDVVLSDPSGVNAVPNGSFENVAFAHRLVNESLVLRTQTAALAVVASPGAARWTIARGDDIEHRGVVQSDGTVESIPLTEVDQGYYTFTVTDASGVVTTAPIAVLNGAVTNDDPRFGVGIHVEDSWYENAARYAKSIGVAEARNDVLWRRNETTRGVYEWDPLYVNGFDKLHQNDIKLLGIVNYGNKLYGNPKIPETPEAIAAYGRYAAAITQRFDLVGLEVFNEFNHLRFNTSACGAGPECYVPLVKSVHDSVRAVDPNMPIVVGSTALYDAEWFDGLWRAGAMQYTDVASFHPYDVSAYGLDAIMKESKASMQEFGGGERPIWITEIGRASQPGGLTLDQQATEVLRDAAITLGNGAEKVLWYDLINDKVDGSYQGNLGLFFREADGVAAYPPKPSAFVYGLVVEQLEGKAAADTWTIRNSRVMSYDFGEGDDAVTLAWSTVEDDVRMTVDSDEPIDVLTLDGVHRLIEPVDGVVTITVPVAGAFIARHPTP